MDTGFETVCFVDTFIARWKLRNSNNFYEISKVIKHTFVDSIRQLHANIILNKIIANTETNTHLLKQSKEYVT